MRGELLLCTMHGRFILVALLTWVVPMHTLECPTPLLSISLATLSLSFASPNVKNLRKDGAEIDFAYD